MSNEIVKVQKVDKTFRLGTNTITALKGVDLRVTAGEFLAIVGPSGSGKSTLLNIIGCIEKPSFGKVFIEGRDATTLSSDQLAELRAHRLGFVFQTFNLLPVLTVAENVEYPLYGKAMDRHERAGLVEKALREVGLESFAPHRPSELSGGQRQRVAIARAVVGSPAMVLADEPTANLDRKTGEGILELMRGLNKSLGTTFIFSTHDPKIMAMADRVVELMDGEITGNHVSQARS